MGVCLGLRTANTAAIVIRIATRDRRGSRFARLVHLLRKRYHEIPVAGYLDDQDLAAPDAVGFDANLYHSMPVAGVLTPEELLRLAPHMSTVVERIHSGPRPGPVTPAEVLGLLDA
jgi:hypothetical protein